MFTVEMKGIAELSAGIRHAIAEYPKLLTQVLYTSAMWVMVPAIRTKIEDNESIFTGTMHQRITARIIDTTSIEFGALGVPYSGGVEEGTDPHDDESYERLTDYFKKKMGMNESEAKRVAILTMNKIAKEGTLAHPFLMPTWFSFRELFWDDVTKRLRAVKVLS